MTAKKIYLIRHGETDFNRQKIVQGSGVDTSLNALGKLQAAAFFDMYKHVPFDRIYTSTLRRSIESVEDFLELGLPHEQHLALNEICWGEKEGQHINMADDRMYQQLLTSWTSGDYNACVTGGESPNQMALRQRPFIELLRSRPEEKNVLVCMHGRAMRALLCQLLRLDLRYMEAFEHHNLCLYKIIFTGNLFYVKRFCDMRHLDSLPE